MPESTLEEAIGGRLMLWVGAIVLVLGIAFFLKYAFDNEWITESMRVALGVVIGLALIGAGTRFVGRGYAGYGQILIGGGLVVLYLSVFAAYSFYDLIGRAPAFVLLALVTVAAAFLADRHEARGLAFMAVGGGFLTPFVIGGTRDAQVTLFTYDALLVAGTMFLARRRDWPGLNALSFVATWLTIGAWAEVHYTAAKWLRTELFLTLFCALFVLLLRETVLKRGRWHPASLVLAAGPVIYHIASLGILGPHGIALLVYLIAVTVAGVGLSVRVGSTGWRMVTWIAVMPPLLEWIGTHQGSQWTMATLVTLCAVFALHALAQADVISGEPARFATADLVLLHLNGLAFMLGTYLALEQVALAWAPAAILGIGAVHGLLARRYWAIDRAAGLHALALAITAGAIATALHFDGPWLTVALGLEGALIVVIGLRLQQEWFRLGGTVVLTVAALRWLFLSALEPAPARFRLLLNESFAVGILLVALFAFVAWRYYLHRQVDDRVSQQGLRLFAVGAAILLVIVLSAENGAYWDVNGFARSDARFAESLSLSFIWALLASAFIAGGMRWQFAPVRYVAIGLFGLTVLKVFLVDLSSLGGIYRILGFIGLGVVLLAVSFLYQRARKRAAAETPPGAVSGQELSPPS